MKDSRTTYTLRAPYGISRKLVFDILLEKGFRTIPSKRNGSLFLLHGNPHEGIEIEPMGYYLEGEYVETHYDTIYFTYTYWNPKVVQLLGVVIGVLDENSVPPFRDNTENSIEKDIKQILDRVNWTVDTTQETARYQLNDILEKECCRHAQVISATDHKLQMYWSDLPFKQRIQTFWSYAIMGRARVLNQALTPTLRKQGYRSTSRNTCALSIPKTEHSMRLQILIPHWPGCVKFFFVPTGTVYCRDKKNRTV